MTTIAVGRAVAYIDDADADLAGYTWSLHSGGYAIRHTARPRRVAVRMHRVIMARKLGRALARHELVDHINGDVLDNRRVNLRLATNSENQFNRDLPAHNSTGYKGVYRATAGSRKPWQAAITINRCKRHLGTFDTPQEAARAYDEAARQLAGQYARGNFS
jgi:hypothetical protein